MDFCKPPALPYLDRVRRDKRFFGVMKLFPFPLKLVDALDGNDASVLVTLIF